MRVLRHVAGSTVVLMSDHRDDTYIDARTDIRYPGFTFIEYVRSGFVRAREKVSNVRAPARLIELAKEHGL